MGREKEYIAYQGQFYTIEWYYTNNEKSPALEYYLALNADHRRRLLYLLKRMGDHGKISDTTKFNNEGDQIYAFKPKPERFLCFFECKGKIIITNAFQKKQQKLPKTEKARALEYKRDYELRVKKGLYYD
jgi:phage-related protein